MKKKLSRVLAVLLGVLMLAVCIPAAAFAEETTEKKWLGYSIKFSEEGTTDRILREPGDSVTIPAPYWGNDYWDCNGHEMNEGDVFTYEMAEEWFGKSYGADTATGSIYYGNIVFIPKKRPVEEPTYDPNKLTVEVHVWVPVDDYNHGTDLVTYAMYDDNAPFAKVEECAKVIQSVELNPDNSFTLPTTINGYQVIEYMNGYPYQGSSKYRAYKGGETITINDVPFSTNGVAKIQAMVPDMYSASVCAAIKKYFGVTTTTPSNQPSETPAETPATEQPAATTFVPQLQSQSSEPAVTVDTRTEQQKEIDEAIANGTWGIEYTTCQKCGYHNWTRQGNVYVCDTCGNTTTEVVSAKGVKGYVGSGAIAAVAPGKTVDDTPKYATAKEAQAAADKREAAYAAAVAAFQKQIAEQNAAYLASLK